MNISVWVNCVIFLLVCHCSFSLETGIINQWVYREITLNNFLSSHFINITFLSMDAQNEAKYTIPLMRPQNGEIVYLLVKSEENVMHVVKVGFCIGFYR